MKLFDNIFKRNSQQNHVLRRSGGSVDWTLTKHPFGRTIFINIVELLTDIYAEVEWKPRTEMDNTKLFQAWKRFADANGQRILVNLYRDKGYTVIAWRLVEAADGTTDYVFWEMKSTEYTTTTNGDDVIIIPHDKSVLYYVMRSPTFEATGSSDYQLCLPYIQFLDAVLNSSCTISQRLGSVLVMSPQSDNTAMVEAVLSDDERKELETELADEYGSLKNQRSILLLKRPMNTQVINMAGLDQRLNDKVRVAILAIVDRIKVPANQVAIIDANSSKSFANGSEMREGDIAKYASFKRLLYATFYDFATEIGLNVEFTTDKHNTL